MLVNGLPTWTPDALMVGVAARPSGYRDVAGLGQWLETAAAHAQTDTLIKLLSVQNAATRQRAAYLLSVALFPEKANAVLRTYPPSQPVWFGPRERGGHYDSDCMVNDTLVYAFTSVGAGA